GVGGYKAGEGLHGDLPHRLRFLSSPPTTTLPPSLLSPERRREQRPARPPCWCVLEPGLGVRLWTPPAPFPCWFGPRPPPAASHGRARGDQERGRRS
uniref:Uncharacterized protein n=1 Tax=Aegilops tauschii subsp. strangulata TaxID=200361 RepID=A0A453D678_AEGTS